MSLILTNLRESRLNDANDENNSALSIFKIIYLYLQSITINRELSPTIAISISTF